MTGKLFGLPRTKIPASPRRQVRTGRVDHWVPCLDLSKGCIPALHQSLAGVVEIQLISTAGAPGGQTERLTYSREIVASEVEIVLGDQLVCRHAVGCRDGDARVILLDCVC